MEKHPSQDMTELCLSSFMPDLPDSSAPDLTAEDRLVVFLASAAQAGGRLTPSTWKSASAVLKAAFAPAEDAQGEARRRAEHRYFVLQTRFHAALLQPAVSLSCFSDDSRLADDMAALDPLRAERFCQGLDRLSPEHARFLRGIREEAQRGKARSESLWSRGLRLLPGCSAWDEMFGEGDAAERGDSHAVIMENGVAQPRRRQNSLMPEPLRRQIDDFSTMMSEAGSACGSVAGDAARCLRALDVQRLFSPVQRDGQQTPARPLTRAADASDALRGSALAAGAVETARASVDLRRMMMEQPYTVVVVGEGKRGKSSLVNALLGTALSPVRESVPETTAAVRFRWGREFRAEIRFLEEQECRHFERFIRLSEGEHAENGVIGERLRGMLEQGPPQGTRRISTAEELKSFLSATDKGSLFSARADVELPAEILRQGLTLVDTPGLNATDPVQNYLAYDESLAADCLIFVMDARRPESSSELALLRQLAHSGRAASVIGVVTGMDRLNETATREHALGRARLLMDTAAAEGMEVLGLVAINAREAMQARCSDTSGDAGDGFRELCELIAAASSARNQESARVQRIRKRGLELASTVRREAATLVVREQMELPDENHTELLRRHVERLESVMENCSSQVWSFSNSATLDMEAWRKEQGRALDNWQERAVLRIMDAATKHADSLGFPAMFKPKNWKRFDEEEVPRIARECLEDLLSERRDIQHDWNEKLRQFGEKMQEISVICLDAVVGSEAELRSISDVPFNSERWLVNANSMMKKVGLVAMGLAIRRGGGLGLGIVLGNMGWWALLPVAVVGSVVWTLMKLGSPSRCRRIIMARKEEAVRKWAAEQRKRLDEVLNENLEDISQAYGKAVNEGFVPALSVLAEEASALRVYLDVLDKMRLEVGSQAEELKSRAVKLEQELALLT